MTDKEDPKGNMPQGDIDFLVACLQNTTGGSVQVDIKAIANSLGYANHRSVGNRITALRKKYNLPFNGSSCGTSAKALPDGDDEPKIPKTPNSNKVKKPRTPAKKKVEPKSPASKSKKVAKKEDFVEEQEEENYYMAVDEAEVETEAEDLAVKTPENKAEDEDEA